MEISRNQAASVYPALTRRTKPKRNAAVEQDEDTGCHRLRLAVPMDIVVIRQLDGKPRVERYGREQEERESAIRSSLSRGKADLRPQTTRPLVPAPGSFNVLPLTGIREVCILDQYGPSLSGSSALWSPPGCPADFPVAAYSGFYLFKSVSCTEE